VNGLSVASIRGARHAILLVSDLEGRELTQLSTIVSVPLVDQLLSGLIPPAPKAMAMFYPNIAIERLLLAPNSSVFVSPLWVDRSTRTAANRRIDSIP
jgi:hypothetical protein